MQGKKRLFARQFAWWIGLAGLCLMLFAKTITNRAYSVIHGASCTLSTPCFTPLVKFDNELMPEGTWSSGNFNLSPLAQGRDGNLYGTTEAGGAPTSTCPSAGGTFFRMTPNGSFKTLHVFQDCAPTVTNGLFPQSGVMLGNNGIFYGTTQQGGTGTGTIFSITTAGALTTLFDFPNDFDNPPTTDGSEPVASLVEGTDGNFYGTNTKGGKFTCGTIFKITSARAFSPMFSFPKIPFCEEPFGTLIQATDRNFYGTTRLGGAHGHGMVFKVSPGGSFSTFYSFAGPPADGQSPNSALVQGTDRNFYGTTESGGHNNAGTAFKITPSGIESILHHFGGSADDGNKVDSPLIQASDGNFYGTTVMGGPLCNAASTCGTIYQLTPEGAHTTLFVFNNADGYNPAGGLLQYTDGTFYGMTSQGGNTSSSQCFPPDGCGTVYHFSIGLEPFVNAMPTSGKVGSAVTILGTNLTGASSVTFDGTPAKFTVVAGGTEITTTVPANALTGKIEVVTPSGKLFSNAAFRVTPTISSFMPTSGPPGTTVMVLGESFTGATAVTFGGVKATSFTVHSYIEIIVTVPTGAKTGEINVTTPGGTAASAENFTVTP